MAGPSGLKQALRGKPKMAGSSCEEVMGSLTTSPPVILGDLGSEVEAPAAACVK